MKKYHRVLLKISGESLAGKREDGILSVEMLNNYADVIAKVVSLGVEIGVVIGAGNIYRGKIGEQIGIERTTGDYMGMIATVINSLALQNVLEARGIDTRVMSAIPMDAVAEPYIRRRAVRHLEKKRVVIFAGGTGNPFFSTDTAAALRANEIEAEVILMAKNGVDGVYSADPRKNKDAILYKNISYDDVIHQHLQVMDTTAVSLCMDNHIEIKVFNMMDTENLIKVVQGEEIGTTISNRKGE